MFGSGTVRRFRETEYRDQLPESLKKAAARKPAVKAESEEAAPEVEAEAADTAAEVEAPAEEGSEDEDGSDVTPEPESNDGFPLR